MTTMKNDSHTSYNIFDSPCLMCKRRDCTMTMTGKCDFVTYTEQKPVKERNYVKKQKNKKRVYYRGKF